MNKQRLLRLVGLVVVVTLVIVAFMSLTADYTHAPATKPSVKPKATNEPFSKSKYSLQDPASVWVIANKKRPLEPQNYVPNDLVPITVNKRKESAQIRSLVMPSIDKLFAAAEQNGTPLRVSSAYRSYSYQVGLYNGYVEKQGQQVADSQSARPGFSEHQTGLALDVSPAGGGCEVELCFATTPSGQWLAANAYKYGFIIRYSDGQTPITGYSYEPWHLRYVGEELAMQMRQQSIPTMERFFDTGDAADY